MTMGSFILMLHLFSLIAYMALLCSLTFEPATSHHFLAGDSGKWNRMDYKFHPYIFPYLNQSYP